jgi:putative SOS response-associated peptidase YedK
MCYNIAYIEKRAERVASHYGASFKPEKQPLQFFHQSGFVHPEVYVITQEEPQWIQPYHWGLMPAWCKTEEQAREISNHTLNAMCETVFEKPSFRASIRSRRCLVIVSGFYEWHSSGKKKFPFYIHHGSRSFFSMGGIYDHWVNSSTGQILRTFSILTTPANRLLAQIHNSKKRMPLIFQEPVEKQWINPNYLKEEIEALMQPLPDGELKAYSISRRITDRTQNSNTVQVMEPFVYEELQGFGLNEQ